MSQFIIYGLVDPRTDEVRYIGKSMTGLKRPRSHAQVRELVCNTPKSAWIKKLIAQSWDYGVVILDECVDAEALSCAEINWIATGYLLGWRLTNCTPGGDGLPRGFKHSEITKLKMRRAKRPLLSPEHKAKIGAAHIGMKHTPATIAKMTGRRLSSAHRRRLSVAKKGKRLSKQHRLNMSKALLGHPTSLATRLKISAANKGKKLSTTTRRKISKTLRGRRLPAVVRNKISRALRGKPWTVARREAQS